MMDETEIGYENGEAWIQAEIATPLFGPQTVVFDKHCDVLLNAKQCRELAAWLLQAASTMEE
jgi:adenosine deaminase